MTKMTKMTTVTNMPKSVKYNKTIRKAPVSKIVVDTPNGKRPLVVGDVVMHTSDSFFYGVPQYYPYVVCKITPSGCIRGHKLMFERSTTNFHNEDPQLGWTTTGIISKNIENIEESSKPKVYNLNGYDFHFTLTEYGAEVSNHDYCI